MVMDIEALLEEIRDSFWALRGAGLPNDVITDFVDRLGAVADDMEEALEELS